MEDRFLSVHISKQTVQKLKYFVYQNKKYPINFDSLKNNCTYFYQNRKEFRDVVNINLINEDEKEIQLTEESIKSFISICQNEDCQISLSSVIPLQYLAYKFDFPELKEITDNFVTKHSKELLFEKLLFNNKENQNDDQHFFNTINEEQYLSNHLNEYVDKKEMLLLRIPVAYRVLNQYLKNKNNKVDKKMIDFLFNYLDKHGRKASILFSDIDFEKEQVNVIHRLITEYKDKFDFNFINETLAKTTLQLTNDMARLKEEFSEVYSKMKRFFLAQQNELKKMKEEERRKEIQRIKEDKKRKEKYDKEMADIKLKDEQRMIDIENKFKQICDRQNILIENSVIQKYHKIVLEMMNTNEFKNYIVNTNNRIVDEIIDDWINSEQFYQKEENKNDLNHSTIQNISCLNRLFKILSTKDSNIGILPLFTYNRSSLNKFIIDNLINFNINNDICEYLYQKNLFVECLHDIFDSFDEFSIEIEYPTQLFPKIANTIYNIIKQNMKFSKQMKLCVSINKNLKK